MGLISKLKNMFAKNIDCSADLSDNLVHFFTTKGRKVKLGTSIVVKEGYSAVIVCKDKVTDVLAEGKHKIENATIPATFKFMKLYKIDQHGHSPNSFKCDFYFVNKRFIRNFPFTSDVPFFRKKDPLGRVEAYTEGTVTINIDDPKKLITYLLIDNAYIKDKKADKEIALEIGNMVNKKLEKIDLTFEEIMSQGKYVNSFLNSEVIIPMDFMGISVSNISVNSITMSSKLQKKLSLTPVDEKVEMPAPQIIVTSDGGMEMNLNEGIALSGDEPDLFTPTMLDNKSDNATTKTCDYCGNTIKSTARFCEFCGNKQ